MPTNDAFSQISTAENDDLPIMPVGIWTEMKYRHVSAVSRIFSTSMKNRWDNRVYIDLFSGPGYAQIRDDGRILKASPLLAQSHPDPFTRYILCEKNPESAAALEARSQRLFPDNDVKVINADCNESLEAIMAHIPTPSSDSTVLSLCFADPYRLSNLRFVTLQALSSLLIDFLVLIPTGMDASRNIERYSEDTQDTPLDTFLGTSEWRAAWANREPRDQSADAFLTNFFSSRMSEFGYIDCSPQDSEVFRNPHRGQLLYRLAYYSRNELGNRFWRETKRYINPQGSLF